MSIFENNVFGVGAGDGADPLSQAVAWVTFDGTTSPPTIKASKNVDDVVKVAVAKYEVHFATNMNNVNYCVVGMAGDSGFDDPTDYGIKGRGSGGVVKALDKVNLSVTINNLSQSSFADLNDINVLVFGGI